MTRPCQSGTSSLARHASNPGPGPAFSQAIAGSQAGDRMDRTIRGCRAMGRIIDFAQYRRHAASAVAGVARLLTSERARSERISLELEAVYWMERHGPVAYGLARERIHEAWRLGDHEAAVHWQAIREMVGRLGGRRIGPAPERE